MKYNVGDIITLEDNIEYVINDIVSYKDNKYVYLSIPGDKDGSSILIQKVIVEDNEECLVNLDSEEEFYAVLYLIGQKHMNDN